MALSNKSQAQKTPFLVSQDSSNNVQRVATTGDLQIGFSTKDGGKIPKKLTLTGGLEYSARYIVTADANVQIVDDDIIVCIDHTAASTHVNVILPSVPLVGRFYVINDAKGLATSKNIIIVPGVGTQTINGQLTFAISINYGTVGLEWNGTEWIVLFQPSSASSIFTNPILAMAGISGSLQQLVNGSSFLVAGSNITITSQSNGQVVVAAASGGSPGALFYSPADRASLASYGFVWANPATTGNKFGVVIALTCVGAKVFCSHTSGTETVKVSLWNKTTSTLLQSVTTTNVAAGTLLSVTWPVAQVLDPSSEYIVTSYVSTASIAYQFDDPSFATNVTTTIARMPCFIGTNVMWSASMYLYGSDGEPGTISTLYFAVSPVFA